MEALMTVLTVLLLGTWVAILAGLSIIILARVATAIVKEFETN